MQSRLAVVAALAALSASALAAQTGDQARLVFSIGLGQTTGGGELWRVGRQPFNGDTIAVSRSFRRSFNISFGGTYYPNDNLGFNAEAQLLGLGTRDGCTVVSAAPPDSVAAGGCNSLNSKERGTSSGSLSLGLVYRVFSRSPIYPYVRANVGMVVSQESFLQMVATVPGSSPGTIADLPVYLDDSPSNIQPYFSFAGGVVTTISRGYQLRFEVRDNWVRVPVVTGPTSGAPAFTPPHASQGRHVLSFLLGFEVVLERKRGRRY